SQIADGHFANVQNAGGPDRHLLSGHAGGGDEEGHYHASRTVDWTIERDRAAGSQIDGRRERGERFLPRRYRSKHGDVAGHVAGDDRPVLSATRHNPTDGDAVRSDRADPALPDQHVESPLRRDETL